jgi:hypothetical protein
MRRPRSLDATPTPAGYNPSGKQAGGALTRRRRAERSAQHLRLRAVTVGGKHMIHAPTAAVQLELSPQPKLACELPVALVYAAVRILKRKRQRLHHVSFLPTAAEPLGHSPRS